MTSSQSCRGSWVERELVGRGAVGVGGGCWWVLPVGRAPLRTPAQALLDVAPTGDVIFPRFVDLRYRLESVTITTQKPA